MRYIFLLIKFLAFFVFFLQVSSIVKAQEIEFSDINDLDRSIVISEEKGFNTPDSVLVTPINLNSNSESVNSIKWVKGIFYYTINKLGYGDIPYHYIVLSDGRIIKGNSSGDEKLISVAGFEGNPIIIGYLNSGKDDSFSGSAQNSLKNLILSLVNRNVINPERLDIIGTQFVKNSESNLVSFEKRDLSTKWVANINSIKKFVKKEYMPAKKDYKLKVVDVQITTNEVNPGDVIDATIKLKNLGDFGMFGDSESEIVLTKTGSGFSKFYLNDTWLSQTQIGVMREDQILLPGQENTFSFKLKAPLHRGEISEDFSFRTLSGFEIPELKLKIKLRLKAIKESIIEIKNNSSGFVNIRKNPNSSEVVRKVTPGERFILIELNQQTLWAKIDLGDGESGWLAAWQFSYI